MSAGQLEAHLFGGAVQGPSWSLTTDRHWDTYGNKSEQGSLPFCCSSSHWWRYTISRLLWTKGRCGDTCWRLAQEPRQGDLDHSRGTREYQKLSPPGCVLQLQRGGRRPLTCEDVGGKKTDEPMFQPVFSR